MILIDNGEKSCFSEGRASQKPFYEMVAISLLYHSFFFFFPLVIQEKCLVSIKYVVQSGRKAVCPLLHWQSGIHPSVETAIHLPAPAGQQSGEENSDLDK